MLLEVLIPVVGESELSMTQQSNVKTIIGRKCCLVGPTFGLALQFADRDTKRFGADADQNSAGRRYSRKSGAESEMTLEWSMSRGADNYGRKRLRGSHRGAGTAAI